MPQPVVTKRKTLMQKQLPTIVGVFVLVGALISGLLLFKSGTGVFAPRATPQTTPKNVRLTNVTDTGFTVSFFTDEATTSFVKYGLTENKLNLQASDDRTQLSGVAGNYNVHHITVRGLKPNTVYFYVLGTSSEKTTFDNQGKPFSVTTATALTSAPDSTMIYGNLYSQDGAPAEGSVIYITMSDIGPLSSLVRNTGGWGISLATARNTKGTNSATFNKDTTLNLLAQGKSFNQTLTYQTTIANSQPVMDLKFGESLASAPTLSPSPVTDLTTGQSASMSAISQDNLIGVTYPDTSVDTSAGEADEPSNTGDDGFFELEESGDGMVVTPSPTTTLKLSPTPTITTTVNSSAITTTELVAELDLTAITTDQVEHISQPVIKGEAKPNVVVTIEIHSDNQIQTSVVADSNGDFELDLATLGQDLEPGEHTITYSYNDPTTGELITTTKTFYVGGSSTEQLALASTTNTTTYGSGSPYSSPTPTQKITPTVKLSPTVTVSSSRSAVVSTSSGTFNSGSFEVTLALILAGLFFITGGIWSWWLAVRLEEESN